MSRRTGATEREVTKVRNRKSCCGSWRGRGGWKVQRGRVLPPICAILHLAILLQADWTLVFILAAAEFNKVMSYTHFIVHTHCMKCRQHNIGGGSCFPACQLDIVKMQCASCNLWQVSIMEKCKILVKMHIQSHTLQPSTSPCNLQSYSPIFCRQIFSGLICWNPVALGHLVHFWRPAAILRARCSHRTGQCWNGYKHDYISIIIFCYLLRWQFYVVNCLALLLKTNQHNPNILHTAQIFDSAPLRAACRLHISNCPGVQVHCLPLASKHTQWGNTKQNKPWHETQIRSYIHSLANTNFQLPPNQADSNEKFQCSIVNCLIAIINDTTENPYFLCFK